VAKTTVKMICLAFIYSPYCTFIKISNTICMLQNLVTLTHVKLCIKTTTKMEWHPALCDTKVVVFNVGTIVPREWFYTLWGDFVLTRFGGQFQFPGKWFCKL